MPNKSPLQITMMGRTESSRLLRLFIHRGRRTWMTIASREKERRLEEKPPPRIKKDLDVGSAGTPAKDSMDK
jgi:hypothetical protein